MEIVGNDNLAVACKLNIKFNSVNAGVCCAVFKGRHCVFRETLAASPVSQYENLSFFKE